MRFIEGDVEGDPNIGLYGFATDSYVLLGKGVEISGLNELGIPIIRMSYFGSRFSGIFFKGNSNFILSPSDLEHEEEVEALEHVGIIKIRSKYNAIGNLVLLNDKACLISPLLKNQKKHLEDMLGIECEVRSIGGENLVGSVAIVTNKGLMAHPRASEEELDFLEEFFGVPAGRGTLNSGSIFLGGCAIGNSDFFILSRQSTGIEMARVSEIFDR